MRHARIDAPAQSKLGGAVGGPAKWSLVERHGMAVSITIADVGSSPHFRVTG